MLSNSLRSAALALLLAGVAACGAGDAGPGEAAAPRAPSALEQGPTPGDLEYAQLTAAWEQEALDGCGRVLRETLGTRDLVQGALDEVRDPEGRAAAELEDARSRLRQGNEKVDALRPTLQAGECTPEVTLALDEAVQLYVKAGTSAVQAGRIAGS